MKESNVRPVRLQAWAVYQCDANTEVCEQNLKFVYKSDVHYCAEKVAIDLISHYLTTTNKCEYKYILCKIHKNTKVGEKTKKSVIDKILDNNITNVNEEKFEGTIISTIYVDESTKQVVID